MGRAKLEQEIQSCLQAVQYMDNMYEEYAKKNGLTYMSLYILETIYEYGCCTQKQISEVTLYPKQTVNMVIRLFLEKDWVTLKQAESDRRSKSVQLTESGKIFAKRVVEPYWKAADDAFGEVESEERKALVKGLNTFSRSLSDKVQKIL